MELDSNAWIERWSDHLMKVFHEDSDAVLARNAEAIELGHMDGLPDEVLALFRINLEGTREDPEGTILLLQASYEAAFRTIKNFLRALSSPSPAAR